MERTPCQAVFDKKGEGFAGNYCPLTQVAKKYTDKHVVGFDIFLPSWLAKHNKAIFTSLFAIGLAFVIYRLVP